MTQTPDSAVDERLPLQMVGGTALVCEGDVCAVPDSVPEPESLPELDPAPVAGRSER